MPSLQINRPPQRHFLPQRPKWMLRLLRHHVICRVPENRRKEMVLGLTPCVNRSAARMGLARVMPLRRSVTHSPSAMGSVDL
ncbi:MAG: hypothetical protein WAW39_02225 [Prosthecobacter sp.]|uniref:hypothetical protein n=1 Tax=Prosthecobacter sp. TaxID=1965333 RepID=UPI003BAEC656